MHSNALVVLLALQSLAVLFIALHNWIPLGSLNNVRGVRVEFPTVKLLVTTLSNFVPSVIGLAATAFYVARGRPGWVFLYLWIFYGLALCVSIKEWWLPYLLRPNPVQIERYRTMYAGTHAILPERNGLRPNTLHVIFDLINIAILIDLFVLSHHR